MGPCSSKRKNFVTTLNTKSFVIDNQLLDRFTGHQVQYLKTLFNAYSSNSSLDKKNFIKLFANLKSFPKQVVDKCFALFSDNTPSVQFRTFCLVLAQLLLSSKESQAKFVFSLFDSDCDEKLNELEFDLFLRSQYSNLQLNSQDPAENVKLIKNEIKLPLEKNEFVSWALRNVNLNQVLKPFELIPSALTEKQIITPKIISNERLETGEFVYLINNDWWVVWKSYVKFDTDERKESVQDSISLAGRRSSVKLEEKPVAIDNERLLESDGIRLRKDLQYKVDYFWVKKDIWDHLLMWYGGGPVIKRKVVLDKNAVVIDLYPLIYCIIPCDNHAKEMRNKKKYVVVFKDEKNQRLLNLACEAHDKNPENSRVYYQNQGTWVLANPSQSLELTEGNSEILLETSYSDKGLIIWPRDNVHNSGEIHSSGTQYFPNTSSVSTGSNRSINNEKSPAKSASVIMPGISGLQNLGNTCYLNSVLQSLLHSPMFSEFFTGDSVNKFIHPSKSREKNVLALKINTLAKELASNKSSRVTPSQFYKSFIKKFPMFEGTDQHDCHECLSLILDVLHEELKRIEENSIHNTLVLENPVDKKFEVKEADEQWKNLQGNHGSLISDVCGGQIRTTITCENCGNRKVLFEIFNHLSLPIPANMDLALNVTVVLLNGSMTQIAVLINKFSKVVELIKEVSNLASIPKEKIIFAEYFQGSVLMNLNKYENEPILRFIRETSNLFAYEYINSAIEAESLGKKFFRYVNQGFEYLKGQHVDVLDVDHKWKSGKVVENKGDTCLVSLDYEYKTEAFPLSCISPFRTHTKYEVAKIMNYVVYHQVLRGSKIEFLGFPQIVSIGSWYTFTDLYHLIQKVSMRLCKDKTIEYSQNIFKVTVLDSSNLKCGLCKSCNGCLLPQTKTDLAQAENICFGVQWEESFFSEEIIVHESVSEVNEKKSKIKIDISDCFNSFTEKEQVESKCEKCANDKLAMQIDVWRVPDILILSLKRFAYEKGVFDKIDHPVTLPFYAFDISQWVKGVEISGGFTLSTTSLQNAYDLYAIILHTGGITGGHYTTLVKVNKNDTETMWVLFDDALILHIKEDPDNINIAKNAYILFYRRRKFSSSNVINLTHNFT